MLSSTEQLQTLIDFFHTGQHLRYAKNEYITGPDESPHGVIFIESGLVKSYDITKYGEENLLIIRKSGEIIGLTWAITGDVKKVINTALVPTTTWMVSRDRFLEFVRNHPEASAPVLDTITTMYRLHSDRIMTLAYRTVRERLASLLLSMAERFGKKSGNSIIIDVPLKQQDIASSISATRETTSRTLTQFQQQSLVSIDQSIITIRNVSALKKVVS